MYGIHTATRFSKNLLAIEIKKKLKVKMNKPVYLGLLILKISEKLMYEFWYDYILTVKCQCCSHIKTSQLICIANQLTGFYMRAALALNGLNQSIRERKTRQTDKNSFIINIKTNVYEDIPNDVEKRFDTSNYEVKRPLPK